MAKNSKTQRFSVKSLNAVAPKGDSKSKAKAAIKKVQAKVQKQAVAAKKQAVKDIKQSSAPRVLRFLGKNIDFTMQDVKKKFSKAKPEEFGKPRSYHVELKDGKKVQQIAIPAFIEKMTGIKLEWRTGQTGNPVGTYSTGNAAKFLARAGFPVKTREGQPVVYVAPEKTSKAGTPEMAAKMAKLRAARDAKAESKNKPASKKTKTQKKVAVKK